MTEKQNKSFKENYHKAVKKTASKQGYELKDYAKMIGVNNSNNLSSMLKNGYPNGLLKAIDPFVQLGASVEIRITFDNGEKIILK